MRTTLKEAWGAEPRRTETGRRCSRPARPRPSPSTGSRSRRVARAPGSSAALRCGSESRASSSRPVRRAARTSTSTSPSRPWRRRRRRCKQGRAGSSTSPLPGQPAIALVIGYDHRKADGQERLWPLRHADARPRRPGDRLDLAALVPARPARGDPLPGTARRSSTRSTPRTRPAARRARSQTVQRAHRHPDQLPHHGQLPRLPADRRPARRRLDRRRPPLLQRPQRPDGLRDDRPAARATSG